MTVRPPRNTADVGSALILGSAWLCLALGSGAALDPDAMDYRRYESKVSVRLTLPYHKSCLYMCLDLLNRVLGGTSSALPRRVTRRFAAEWVLRSSVTHPQPYQVISETLLRIKDAT